LGQQLQQEVGLRFVPEGYSEYACVEHYYEHVELIFLVAVMGGRCFVLKQDLNKFDRAWLTSTHNGHIQFHDLLGKRLWLLA
jgi:hypothetical protein